jgi:hypothetical protein
MKWNEKRTLARLVFPHTLESLLMFVSSFVCHFSVNHGRATGWC